MSDLGFKGKVPGAWRVPTDFKLTSHVSNRSAKILLPNLALYIPDALSGEDCDQLQALFAQQDRAPVAVSGYQTSDPNEVGSVRATGWGPELGNQLWKKIRTGIRDVVLDDEFEDFVPTGEFTPTDWYEIAGKRKEHWRWVPTGISPVLRFMEYKCGGKHNTHYDMGFDYEAHNTDDHRRTLMSVVWYLTEEPNTGGCTRFIEDHQSHLPIQERNLDDWTRSAREDEVLAKQEPHRGGCLIFWHRMAHDVEEFLGKSRIIIRGDIEFTALD